MKTPILSWEGAVLGILLFAAGAAVALAAVGRYEVHSFPPAPNITRLDRWTGALQIYDARGQPFAAEPNEWGDPRAK